ncbi:hypothetical protein M427DRAFT_27628 [Gonapodya prolifera JEL478]|uniref:Nucleolar protein 16 n=1 Tax=Gonapodya prolifera (strain JEL478) TaxID=1344416 RepID=A0A139AWX1_GONPJ|nr:hypothetical protein M427DRAFT_27628 [Gonapodya prolifera JEL478]|eukprot:KXS21199.1 hypothetical protein M427DRAFT_27628 [Gonapodya prolifera JEL478]
MTRPAKRRKVKNPSQKVTRRRADAKRKGASMALVHPLISKNWQAGKTLEENYETLGLLASVNGITGGKFKKTVKDRTLDDDDVMGDAERERVGKDASASGGSKDLVKQTQGNETTNEGFGGLAHERFPEDISREQLLEMGGEVGSAFRIGLVVGKKNVEASNPETEESGSRESKKEPKVADELERVAKELSQFKPIRHFSEQEEQSLRSLIKKHGDNFDAMARDKKLNPFLFTAGQLRRKCEKLVG